MKHLIGIVLLSVISINCHAQSFNKLIKMADKYYKDGFYTEAVNTYLLADEKEPGDLELAYRIGQAYLKSKYKDRALPYLKKVYENISNPKGQLLYNLALAYQYNHQFMEALDHFTAYREITDNTFAADQHIMQCAIGIEYFNNPKDVKITNLKSINSDNQDYAPLITADGNSLIFTSRREGSTGGDMAYDNNYYEDIYIAHKKNNQWAAPEKIKGAVNTNFHECGAAISPDGKQLFIYMDEGDGDFYVSTFNSKSWGEPKAVGGVNSPYRELSISMNGEGNKLYFSSNRPGGYGGFDIYVSTLDDFGRWGKPINLGPKINTSGDEDAPFIHADGETLYFSSTGHLGMGGFDIFKSKYLREKWTTPINLAFPINTAQDDNYFVITKNNEYGYYATAREDGLGGNDIYAILMDKRDFIQEKKDAPLMTLSRKKDKETFLVGKVRNIETGDFLEAEIILSDNEKNIVMTRTFSDPETGTFRISIPEGTNLGLTVESDGYLFYSQNIRSSALESYKDNTIDIALQESKVGTIGILKNIFFDTNKTNIRKESLVELNQIYTLLKAQPNIVIQINGHTDDIGDDAYNQQLSEKRARAVADYLLNYGLSADRITARGFGESKPIASNKFEENGRALNRRTEIEIIKILDTK
ncbi:outer membrane protein OmpA-like peptidoglycan-associated protein/tetratricopeptide (TPR) repeat protein [Catalinimonas alkaloidigena]|uniref:OmpA family protein n=1 Tax=Catalinimonas alkaloidigena TaxID=1075417 RepID=UPI002404E4A2|nr:OmpA family protein [Catalinimonas alkaloidigena]MDF9796840.1 outer membrane protein OmpA-like peptidoglycan-associated protein/tetratricopeptide (TPR) repeat protein [Catalinimonas alkaloidigena]